MEDIFDVLTESAATIAPCNHNHALVQNPFAWTDEADEETQKPQNEVAQENNAK